MFNTCLFVVGGQFSVPVDAGRGDGQQHLDVILRLAGHGRAAPNDPHGLPAACPPRPPHPRRPQGLPQRRCGQQD